MDDAGNGKIEELMESQVKGGARLSGIFDSLLKRKKGEPSILFVGQPGVGKTAMAKSLAEHIARLELTKDDILNEMARKTGIPADVLGGGIQQVIPDDALAQAFRDGLAATSSGMKPLRLRRGSMP